jgi:ketosteroid isomerase-like protein
MRPLSLALCVALLWPSGRAVVRADDQTGPGPLSTDLTELLDADRAFSRAAASTDVVAALSGMFTSDVIVPGPQGLTRGRAAVVAALRAETEHATGHASWAPIRGGLSADGQHGFTFGYLTLTAPDGATTPFKYMAYWVRLPEGWRVAGYKRARRAPGAVSTAAMAPHVPSMRVPTATDAGRLEAQRRSLIDAERAFSDRAQRVGLGPAFAEFASESAVNMGGLARSDYVVGPAAIGAAIGAGAPGTTSPVSWSSDTVLVASSGDLGISFGYIRQHGGPPSGGPSAGQPFFTIWVRASHDAPWRYIAE